MKIETEFSPGDKVWYLTSDFMLKFEKIFAVVTTDTESFYIIKLDNYKKKQIGPDRCASTREALKAKLIDNINKLFEG